VEEKKTEMKEKTSRTRWHRLRQAVQALTFAIFLVLLWSTVRDHVLPVNNIFFNLDPLAGLGAMISSRSLIPDLLAGTVIALILAVFLGRAWCGWICPLGTVLDWTPSRKAGKKNPDISPWWRQVKYFLLIVILFGAVFGSLTMMLLDPITIIVRAFANAVIPGLTAIVNGIQASTSDIEFLQPAAQAFNSLVRPWLLTEQPFLWSSLILLGVLVAILALNAVRARFWCRFLCPLGGLLGLISKVSLFRVHSTESHCKSCGSCATVCPTGAIDPEQKYGVSSGECVLCLDCLDSCRFGAFKLGRKQEAKRPHRLDTSRRQFLTAIGAGIIGGLLVKLVPLIDSIKAAFIRPPGTDDSRLMERCIRCGECIRVCPTGTIQPVSSVTSSEHLWTPALNMRTGFCDYSCNACGQVCPTGAITKLTLQQKRTFVIGKAVINTKRCLPYAKLEDCGVCEEMCPVPQKAIRLRARSVKDSQGKTVTVHEPVVSRGRCIGCGICETRCPVAGEAAIRVFTSVNGDGED
jgi:MauM/NapG family ferredoxin protein